MAKHQKGEKYLQPEQYYIDLYDLFTVNRCLDDIRFYQKVYKESVNTKELKDMSEEKKQRNVSLMLHRHLFAVKATRFKNKKERILKWTKLDQNKQDKYDNTPDPKYNCPDCDIPTESFSKTLDYTTDDDSLRMLFFLKCPKCDKRDGIYDDGEIRVSKPFLCPECNKKATYTHKKKGKTFTWTTKCKSCGYKKVEVDDYEKNKAKREKKEQKDKELLEKYRNEFCLSEEDGKEQVETLEALEVANAVHEEEVKKYDNPIYQRSLQLKKTTISDLEKILTKCSENAKYAKLVFDRPEIGRYVTVPFTIQDTNSSRTSRKSSTELEDMIKKALKDTNWRLINNSVSYRLGYLEGRLKGYEGRENMLKLAGKTKEPKPKTKIDPEKYSKYAANNWVQLARITGKHVGIENVRKRRLEKELEGFFLEISEGPLDCGICGRNRPGNEIWWTLVGLRCADCWKNMKAGVLPKDLKHQYSNDDQWISEWQIKSRHGVHPATRGKLIRQGFLKAKQLKDSSGAIYCTMFLVGENKEFLDKYPKIPLPEPKITFSSSKKDSTQR